MIIRPYKDSDRASILELLRLNTPAFFAPTERKDLVYYLDNYADHFYVIEDKHAILGCGGFNTSDDPKAMRISWDIIHPQHQGKGLGSTLLNFRLKRIKEMAGVKTVSVRTSQLAYPFYEKSGFSIKEIVKDYWAEGFDLYRMERALYQ